MRFDIDLGKLKAMEILGVKFVLKQHVDADLQRIHLRQNTSLLRKTDKKKTSLKNSVLANNRINLK